MGSANPPSQPISNPVPNQTERSAHIPHNQMNPHPQTHGRIDNNSVAMQDRNDRGLHNNDALVGVGGDVRNAFGSSNVNIGKFRLQFCRLLRFVKIL